MKKRVLLIVVTSIIIFQLFSSPNATLESKLDVSTLSIKNKAVSANLELRSDLSWQEVEGNNTSSPSTVWMDVDGDDHKELITYEFYYYSSSYGRYHWTIWEYLDGVLVKKADSIWPNATSAKYQTLYFRIADLDQDTQPEILVYGYWFPSTYIYEAFLGVFHYDGFSLTEVDSQEWQETAGKTTRFWIYAITDLDDDNSLEIVGRCDWMDSSNYYHTSTQVWEYDGSSLTKQDTVMGVPRVSDVVGDSQQELIVDNYIISGGKQEAILRIYNYDGSTLNLLAGQSWQEVQDRNTQAFADRVTYDLDGDGNIEIITRGQWEDSNGIYHAQMRLWRVNRNESTLTSLFSQSWQFVDGYDTRTPYIYWWDLDADGSREIITTNAYYYDSGNRTFQWAVWELENDALTKKAESDWPDASSPNMQSLSFRVVDLDKDSQPEIIAYGYWYPTHENYSRALLAVFHYDGESITLVDGIEWQEVADKLTKFEVFQIIDLDGDDILEIVGNCQWEDSSGYTRYSTQVWQFTESFLFISRQATVEGVPSVVYNLAGDKQLEIVVSGYIMSDGSTEAVLGVYNFYGSKLQFIAGQTWQMVSGKDTYAEVGMVDDPNRDRFVEIFTQGIWIDVNDTTHAQLRLWELNTPQETTLFSLPPIFPPDTSPTSTEETTTTGEGSDMVGVVLIGLTVVALILGIALSLLEEEEIEDEL